MMMAFYLGVCRGRKLERMNFDEAGLKRLMGRWRVAVMGGCYLDGLISL